MDLKYEEILKVYLKVSSIYTNILFIYETVTRSWKVHEPSPGGRFQRTILQTEDGLYDSTRSRKYEMPPDDFVYGLKTRVGTPIKNVVNNVYGRKAEDEIRKSYADIVEDKNVVRRLVTKNTPHFKKLREMNRFIRYGPGEEKPLYKLKMFQDVGSKVTEGIKQFRTYGYTSGNMEDGLDKVIAKVQNEIEESEKKENK